MRLSDEARVPKFAELFPLQRLSGDSGEASTEPWLTPRIALRLWLSMRILLVHLTRPQIAVSAFPWIESLDRIMNIYGRTPIVAALEAMCGDLVDGNEPFPRSRMEYEALRVAIFTAEGGRRGDDKSQHEQLCRLLPGLPSGSADRGLQGGPDLTKILENLMSGVDIDDTRGESVPS